MNKLVLLCFLGVLAVSSASHFRYYTARWNANGLTVDLNVLQAWRASAFCTCGTNCIGGVGSTGNHNWGDGSTFATQITWTSEDCAEDWAEGSQMISHTYGSAGSYVLTFSSCCRISTLQNSRDDDYDMFTTIAVDPNVSGPSASIGLLPIEPVNQALPYTRDLTVLSAIPAGASNVVYSQGTNCGATQQISSLSVTSAGVLSWNPPAHSVGLWTACVYVDYQKDGLSYRIVVDWIFDSEVGAVGNNLPVWDEPPSLADGTIISVNAGDLVNFNMQASDADAADVIMVSATGVPQGATFTAVDGNPGVGTFNWTPTAADTGFVVLTFSAQDGNGGFVPTRSIIIEVDAQSGGGDCDDSQDVPLGSATAGVSSAGDCVELCFV